MNVNDDGFYEEDESVAEIVAAFARASDKRVTRNRNVEIGTNVVTHMNAANVPELLTPAEVAKIFAVDPKTVTRWAKKGLLSTIRTPGGHRRFLKRKVEELAQERFENGDHWNPSE